MNIIPRLVLLLTAAVLLCPAAVRLQAQPVLSWDKTIGGDSWEELNGLLAVPDGIIAAGSSRSGASFGKPGDQSWNFLVTKLDFNGNVLWTRMYGGDLDDRLWAIIPTSDGGFLAGGYAYSGVSGDKSQPSRGDMDVWILKLDGNGLLLWERAYGGLYRDELFDMLELPGGGYLLGCNSWSDVWMDKSEPSRGLQDFWIIRTDAQGNKLWDKTIGGTDYDQLNDLEWAADGNVYVSGGTVSDGSTGELGPEPTKGGMDFWLGKIDPGTGNLLWDHRYGGSGEDYAYALHVSQFSNRIFLGGRSGSMPAPAGPFNNGKSTPFYGGDSDYWLLELDPDGNKLGEFGFGGAGLDDLYAVQENPLGQLVLGGVSDSDISGNKTTASHGGFDYWLVGLDDAGNALWQTNIGGTANDALTKIAFRPDGSYVIGGHSESGIDFEKTEQNFGVNDFWVLSFACDLSVQIAGSGPSSPCNQDTVLLDATIPGCTTCIYTWNTGVTGNILSAPSSAAGAYNVVVQDEFGCVAFDTILIIPPPPPVVDLGADTLIAQGHVLTVGPDPAPGYQYIWSTGDTTSSITVTASGMYALTLTDPGGCSAVGSIQVDIVRKGAVWTPNVFSPNFDGYNDYFSIYTDEGVRQVLTFQVADRWGSLCFRRDRFLPNFEPDGWDGVYRGDPAPPGVYSWFAEIEYLDGSREVLEGSVTILR